jgi:5-methylcytosine-specific restriction enzyme subunit McrC
VEPERLLVDGKLQIYEEVQSRNYFQVRASGNKLVFQAGGFIGLIPVNDRLTIEVVPRTPIGNLDRMLRIAGTDAVVISRITRAYAETDEDLSLIDVLIDELVNALRHIALDGRMKKYERHHFVGAPRSGRVLVADTLRARAGHFGAFVVATSRYERTANNIFNAVLKEAIEHLATELQRGPPRKGVGPRLLALNERWQMFANVEFPSIGRTNVELVRTRLAEVQSEWYKRALTVSIAVLAGRGPSASSEAGPLKASSVIYNLSVAFESYVRNVLKLDASLNVRDGNLSYPAGAERRLFDQPATQALASVTATPDLVLGSTQSPWCAGDIKYKVFASSPDRDDLNQVVTYGVVYSVDHCLLVYPASKSLKGLLSLGLVGTKRTYCYGFDLAAADLQVEEQAMRDAVRTLQAAANN